MKNLIYGDQLQTQYHDQLLEQTNKTYQVINTMWP